MLNNIKSSFSIKDLENLSGVKAHTIRIWEKRYEVFQPLRTDTNIRVYDLKSLQKLLNINFLHEYGYKISKIASYSDEEITAMVRGIVTEKNAKNHALNIFKMAMMNFDHQLFVKTYNWLSEEKTFRQIFLEVFIPLLDEIGGLWQTNTITPAHEHFMSHLIRQKIILAVHEAQAKDRTKFDKTFVLSLPLNEIHDLGLLYLNYEMANHGYQVIYLGESVPLENLHEVKKHFTNIVFVSYFTIQPAVEELESYVETMTSELVDDATAIWLFGRMAQKLNIEKLPQHITRFDTIAECIQQL
ncbi:MerR family transcriptional regulator [Flavobacterium sp. UMI-01]|uniref:MerR family transcriptional regulator n=1 Tax=Flavobacterium sp. UMI-01 TaxID=1441053 RepID=UPI001C7D76DD|nr:MerR family transcriptional regulator [Flavobacterium sp. UMI-01]GIZ08429.1 MerR family transcriptional regulator [Flavobacterium sp. UMI-01]